MEHVVFLFLIMLIGGCLREIKESRSYRLAPYGISIPLDMFAFADSGGGGEKTEDPTPKKIRDARKKGQVAKSPDLNAAIILLIVAVMMVVAADSSIKSIANFLYMNLTEYVNYNLIQDNVTHILAYYMINFFKATALLFVIVIIMGVAANLAQSGFLFSLDPLKPNPGKLNPIEGFKNIFSKKALFNLVKTLLKLILIGSVAIVFVKDNLPQIFATTGVEALGIFTYVKAIIFKLIVRVIAVLLFVGIIDFVFQKYDFKKRLKMSKQEIKEEWKQSEGDPHIKSKRKQKQREMSMNRMMSDVAGATAIITNPTHLAIAIRYDESQDEIPVIVGKGADLIAEKIRKIAKENDIPIIENKPLARTMFKQLEISQQIPQELYKAIAEILAMVINIKKKENTENG